MENAYKTNKGLFGRVKGEIPEIKTIGSIALQSRKEAAKYLANDTKK